MDLRKIALTIVTTIVSAFLFISGTKLTQARCVIRMILTAWSLCFLILGRSLFDLLVGTGKSAVSPMIFVAVDCRRSTPYLEVTILL